MSRMFKYGQIYTEVVMPFKFKWWNGEQPEPSEEEKSAKRNALLTKLIEKFTKGNPKQFYIDDMWELEGEFSINEVLSAFNHANYRVIALHGKYNLGMLFEREDAV